MRHQSQNSQVKEFVSTRGHESLLRWQLGSNWSTKTQKHFDRAQEGLQKQHKRSFIYELWKAGTRSGSPQNTKLPLLLPLLLLAKLFLHPPSS